VDFELTTDQKQLRDAVRDFCRRECPRELLQEWDEKGIFPQEHWHKLSQLGVLGIPFGEDYGGYGGNIIDEVLVVEELARGPNPLCNAFITTVSFGAYSILNAGSETQRRTLLPQVAKGELHLALALTEADGGTDILTSIRTKAERVAGGWKLNGEKVFVSGALESQAILVVARSEENPPKRTGAFTIFLVPSSSEGMEIRPQAKVGNRVPHSCLVHLDNVRLPDGAVLGKVGGGFHQIMATLNNERILIAAQCLGYGRGALEDAVDYAKNRHAFGRPIGQFQSVQHMLAETAMELEMAMLMTFKAAWLQSCGLPCAVESSTAKWAASEAACRAAERGMQVMGGHGYMMEHAMQRYWRDSRLYTFSPITNEMVKNVVGESLGLPRSY
jgi:alkylation response protein AidB-like acyl-CoA dehydrogenase